MCDTRGRVCQDYKMDYQHLNKHPLHGLKFSEKFGGLDIGKTTVTTNTALNEYRL
jgi:hypothetical protein